MSCFITAYSVVGRNFLFGNNCETEFLFGDRVRPTATQARAYNDTRRPHTLRCTPSGTHTRKHAHTRTRTAGPQRTRVPPLQFTPVSERLARDHNNRVLALDRYSTPCRQSHRKSQAIYRMTRILTTPER